VRTADSVHHVGLNAIFLQPRMGGLETYVRQLVPALLEVRPGLRLSLFVNELGRKALAGESWAESVEFVTHPLLGRPYMRSVTEATLLGKLATRQGVDVLQNIAMVGPFRTAAPQITTIADTTWLRYRDPAEWIPTLIWRTLVPSAARRARRVLVFSEAAKKQVAEDLRVETGRIDVVPLGPGLEPTSDPTPDRELRSRLALGNGPIVLCVAPVRAHKNVERLLEALPVIRRAIPTATLVLPGNLTEHVGGLRGRAAALGVEDALVLPGWVDEADLEGLYAAASCFVLPSLNEGFGLPLLEAMRRGVPVACSDASSLPEVAGDAAAYFDPHSPDEIAAAVIRLLTDREYARSLSAKGHQRQLEFTWERAAEKTLIVYERALATTRA